MENADGRYGYRAWDRRPGDGVDPSVALNPAEVIIEVAMQAPVPLPAPYTPRLLGVERTQPGIVEVLGVNPSPMMDTGGGIQSTMRPASGPYQ